MKHDEMNSLKILEYLKQLAIKTINGCTKKKETSFNGKSETIPLLLPSGDEKYYSFWIRDCAMMAESGLIPNEHLKRYIEICACSGQNGNDTLCLKNKLKVPPHTIADHINYDGCPVYFPGTYLSGNDQGDGRFGFFPPHCDNYYFIMMVGFYIEQSGDFTILDNEYNGMTLKDRILAAFDGYNIDEDTNLCCSNEPYYTVDWGFCDSVKKTGLLLMPSILRYNAADMLERFLSAEEYKNRFCVLKNIIKENILNIFFDDTTGWFYSATDTCRQHDVWATAYAVYSGITDNKKSVSALNKAYRNKTAVKDGYVRQILTTEDFSKTTVWQHSIIEYGDYQNGGYWATPVGWYSYALSLYDYKAAVDILNDFIKHTMRYDDKGAPYEYICESTVSGMGYGTSGVLPYIGAKKFIKDSL